MAGESLGSAELELGANLVPLEADLKDAETRVAMSVAKMQALFDTLHADVNAKMSALGIVADKVAQSSAGIPSGGNTFVKGGNEVWGVRGPEHPGSITNPIVTVLEAGKYAAGLGSYGAAVGENSMADSSSSASPTGLATAADMAALSAAIENLARNATPGSRLSVAGASGLGEPNGGERTVVALDSVDGAALRSMAAAMSRLESRASTSTAAYAGRNVAAEGAVDRIVAAQRENQDSLTTAIAALDALKSSKRLDLPTSGSVARVLNALGDERNAGTTTPSSGNAVADTVATLEALKGRGGLEFSTAGSVARVLNALQTGQGVLGGREAVPVIIAGHTSGMPGSSTSGLPFAFGEGSPSGGSGGTSPLALGVGSGGGGGGKRVDVFYHASGEGGGGGGSGGGGGGGRHYTPWWFPHAPGGDNSLLSSLGWGQGIAGMAGVGTAASFAGLGFEHLIFTALGLAGSAGAAVGGGGLLAAGAGGVAGAGLATDLAGIGQAAGDVKNTTSALNQYQSIQQMLAKQIPQTAAAQTALNTALNGFAPAARSAVLAASLTATQFHGLFDVLTAPAEATGANIINQTIQTSEQFLPAFGQYAAQNMKTIQAQLQPFFAWLAGPEGMGIFKNLEDEFQNQLPTGLQLGEQAFEVIARVVDLASQDTGGLVQHLDDLFTRLNSESNMTLDAEVQKLVGDFRLWETFVKMLIVDVYDLFHQDVGTGNSIIADLTTMLDRLHAYEESARGSAELQNIFMVHKTEILDLISILGHLGDAFGNVYMAVAPSAVTVMNDVILPVLDALAGALAAIAKASPLAADALGAFLIASKMGGISGAIGLFRSFTQFMLGTGTTAVAAASTATGASGTAGAAALGGGLPGLLGKLPGVGGAWGASVIAAAASAAIPAVLAGVGGAAILAWVAHEIPGRTANFSPRTGLTGVPSRQATVQEATGSGGRGAGVLLNSPSTGLAGTTLDIEKIGDYSKYSAAQLQTLIAAIKEAGAVKVNGVSEAKDQVLALAEAALKAKDTWNAAWIAMWKNVNNFYMDASMTLPALYDDFNTHMRAIAALMGLTSKQGEQAVATNIQNMVKAVTEGMLDSDISVSQGMAALKNVLHTGMQDNAISWETSWKSMFSSTVQLYDAHLINTTTFLNELRSLSKQANQQIASETEASYQAMFANLKSQLHAGTISQGEYNTDVHNLNLAANTQERADMNEWVGQVLNAMTAAGVASNQGVQAIFTPLNKALVALGQKPLSLVSASTAAVANTVATGVQNLVGPLSGHATGAKVLDRMYMVGEEGPAHPEYVLATNPAYRDRNIPLWMAAGHDLGIPGFFRGGAPTGPSGAGGVLTESLVSPTTISAPSVSGAGTLAVIDKAALTKLTNAANSYLGGKSSGGGGGGITTAGLSGSLIAMVDQISGKKGWNASDWLGVIDLESGGSMTAQNPSSGAYGIAQFINGASEYAQYGGNSSTMVGQLVAMANYIAGRYGNPSNALAHEHAFHWYARGGRIPGYAQGGVATAGSALAGLGGSGGLGSQFSITGALLGNAEYAKIMSWLNGILGTDGDINKTTDLMSFWQGMWGLNSTVSGIVSGGPSSAILTDANGNQYVDQGDVNTAVSELQQYVAWESTIVSDLQQALAMSNFMLGVVPQAVSGAKGYIKGNLSKIASLKKGKQTASVKAQIAALQSQNVTLGGSGTSVGSGGLIGNWNNYLSTLGSYPDTIGGAGGSGYGGELGPAQVSLAQYEQELAALSPAALSAALATAQASSGASSQNSDLTSLLEQQNQLLAQQYEVSQAQYGVLAGPMYAMGQGLPKFGGSFADGGVIPGFPGEARTIIAHAGEVVGQPGNFELHAHGSAQALMDLIDWRIQKNGRQVAITSKRQLPGRPGTFGPVGR